MPFTEKLKWEVKRKAHFKCCWCREIRHSLDVHHIVPESENGPSTFENAAPLCKNCHDIVGHNPKKRKEIVERRNFLYEQCEKSNEDTKKLEEIHCIVTDMKKDNDDKMREVKSIMSGLVKKTECLFSKLETTPSSQWSDTLSQIGTTTSTISTGSGAMIDFGNIHSQSRCGHCGYSGFPMSGGKCPACGGQME
ncbi:MAG: HNH endonuclease [Candidatus Aenigmarchaeota archaeon]|nr:HNH endonuclease [Candidatus Aenigmarchaeota archaeon]